jgi:hypothetical protein
MHMQTRPEYRGELGWREALAAKLQGRAENPVSAWGSGTPGRRKRRAGGLTGASAGRAESPAQYRREAR